jgi:hypothetical protein
MVRRRATSQIPESSTQAPLPRRGGSLKYRSDYPDGDEISRSCLVFPFQRKEKKSSVARTVHSPELGEQQQQQHGIMFGRRTRTDSVDNDQDNLKSSLLKEDYSIQWEPFGANNLFSMSTDEDEEPGIIGTNSSSAREAAAPSQQSISPTTVQPNFGLLLTPPTPVDRNPALQSHQKRLQRRGLYEGEIEPDGVRGQEAVVLPTAKPTLLPPAARDGKKMIIISPEAISTAPNGGSRSAASGKRSVINAAPTTAMYGYPTASRHNISRSKEHLPQQHQQARNLPRENDESTNSDEDIGYMMSDLIPTSPARIGSLSLSATNKRTLGVVVTPEVSTPVPSAAAQRAAAAAAAVATAVTPLTVPHPMEVELDRLNNIAMQHVSSGDYDQALSVFTQVLHIHLAEHGTSCKNSLCHPSVASAHHNIGTVRAKQASVFLADSPQQIQSRAAALTSFQAAARAARDSLGGNHPNVAVSLVRIGFLLLQSRQYQNSIVTFQEALRIRIEHYGPNHGLVANLHNNLGVCHMHLGEFAAGRDQLDKALIVQRHVVEQSPVRSDDHWLHLLELADTLFNIGGLCLEWIRRKGPDASRAADAEDSFRETLEVRFVCFVVWVKWNSHLLTRFTFCFTDSNQTFGPKRPVGSESENAVPDRLCHSTTDNTHTA